MKTFKQFLKEAKQLQEETFFQKSAKAIKKVDNEIVETALKSVDPMKYIEMNSYEAQFHRLKKFIKSFLDNPVVKNKIETNLFNLYKHYKDGEFIYDSKVLLFTLYADYDTNQLSCERFCKDHQISHVEEVKVMLAGLSINYPKLINYSDTLNLDVISLKTR